TLGQAHERSGQFSERSRRGTEFASWPAEAQGALQMNAHKRRAYILGAGVSGLVTAWRLLERGWTVEVFEKETTYGGMSRTWKWRDFLVDVGPHLFHTPDPAMADFWEKEFGDLFTKGDFYSANVKGDSFSEFHPYPLSYEGLNRFPTDTR